MPYLCRRIVLSAFVAAALVRPLTARADVSVESHHTVAETNAFAPFSETQYFARQDQVSTSPAAADVSGDWTGTNTGGSTPTWHWVGSSHTNSVTSFSGNSLNVAANGSFNFALTTTQDFINQGASNGVYSPGGAADYNLIFDVDTPATYFVSVQMSGPGVVQLGSFDGTYPFYHLNTTDAPTLFQQSGIIQAGRYQIVGNASLGIGSLSNGINDFSASGSFSNYNFSLQTPEPDLGFRLILVGLGVATLERRRVRCVGQLGDCG